jgi:hypothetical protein
MKLTVNHCGTSEYSNGVEYDYDLELDVEISGHWIPERRATLLDPAEGGYFEDITAEDEYGNEVELTDKELEKANELLCDARAERGCDE